MNSWQKYFIDMADLVASKSKDPSTKVGAVIVGDDNEVLSTGFNGFPRGVTETAPHPEVGNYAHDAQLHPERWERPKKYEFVEHAERNAIYNAARSGIRLKGATMFLNWEPYPCNECAKAVIQAGIKRVIGPNRPFPGKGGHWEDSLNTAREMLREAGVMLLEVKE